MGPSQAVHTGFDAGPRRLVGEGVFGDRTVGGYGPLDFASAAGVRHLHLETGFIPAPTCYEQQQREPRRRLRHRTVPSRKDEAELSTDDDSSSISP